MVAYRIVKDVVEATSAAGELGYPVVLKALTASITHKSDAGLVEVDLRTEEEVRDAFKAVGEAAGQVTTEPTDVLVARYMTGGRETIVGMTTDPTFGPVLMFGLGGVYVEALQDVAFRVQPVSEIDAQEMVDSIRAHTLLDGIRGQAGVDKSVLVEVIQRISQRVGDHDRIAELDINPFLAMPAGGQALDASIELTES